jgi:hypothetical protein
MGALIAARDLMRAADLRKDTHVDVLHISACDTDWHDVFRLAGGRTGVAAYAARVVYDLGPLSGAVVSWLLFDHFAQFWGGGEIYHARARSAQKKAFRVPTSVGFLIVLGKAQLKLVL